MIIAQEKPEPRFSWLTRVFPHFDVDIAAPKDLTAFFPVKREPALNIQSQQEPGSATHPVWKSNTAHYLELVAVRFATHRELTESFAVFYDKSSPLFEAPFRSVGDNTIFLPKEAQQLFADYLSEQGYTTTFSDVVPSTGRSRKLRAAPAI